MNSCTGGQTPSRIIHEEPCQQVAALLARDPSAPLSPRAVDACTAALAVVHCFGASSGIGVGPAKVQPASGEGSCAVVVGSQASKGAHRSALSLQCWLLPITKGRGWIIIRLYRLVLDILVLTCTKGCLLHNVSAVICVHNFSQSGRRPCSLTM